MLRRILLVCVAMFIMTPCLSAQDTTPAKSDGCSSLDLAAVLRPTDPVYAESVEVTHALENRGYAVRCVLQSKMAHFFEGQLGAALFRTGSGDFEALFLRKPHTFASVRLLERQENGRYLYFFQGSPQPSSVYPMDCARRTFFARRANRLFVTEDKWLAPELGEVLNSI